MRTSEPAPRIRSARKVKRSLIRPGTKPTLRAVKHFRHGNTKTRANPQKTNGKAAARGSDAENFSGNVEFQFVSARRAPLNKRHAFSENFPGGAERAFLRGMRRRRARGAARGGDGGGASAGWGSRGGQRRRHRAGKHAGSRRRARAAACTFRAWSFSNS